jgi:dCMP deaminase
VNDRPSWDDYFLGIAVAVSARADCRRRQHGAVIVKANRIVATGYNGAHPGGPSCLAGECPRGLLTSEQSKSDYGNCIALHAEQNAIAYASRRETEGATIYITGAPCDMCAKLIAAAGITRTVYQ